MGRSIFMILGLLVVVLSLSGTGADHCPPDWSHFNQSCYRFVKDWKTWDEAEENCGKMEGSHLASIHTQEESKFLSKVIPKRLFPFPVWTGLRDPQKENRWEWSDGSKFSNNPWMQEQLDNLGKCNGCVELRRSLLGHLKLNDADCESKRSFICQFQPKVIEGSP